ncbi:hypothetical protein ACFL1N_12775 [Thermodesulfobacteriota bacterium]
METISNITSTMTAEISAVMDGVPGLFSLVTTLAIMTALTL